MEETNPRVSHIWSVTLNRVWDVSSAILAFLAYKFSRRLLRIDYDGSQEEVLVCTV